MAINNEPQNGKKYKYGYSEEIDLLEKLEREIVEAANNLDIDRIESLISSFESQFYSDFHLANQESFDNIKINIILLIEKIKKEKALAAKRQLELQAKENSYQSILAIKKGLERAHTTSEYNKYKNKYTEWLKHNKGTFGWTYNKKINTIKEAIENSFGPETAIDELKDLISSADQQGGFEDDTKIKDWMNKYPLNVFHEVHKKEVMDLTDQAYSMVKIPDEEISSNPNLSIMVPGYMFLSPTQAYAVNDLKKLMTSNNHNYNSILNWIHTYRNISFTSTYRQAISTLIPADYGLKLDKTYTIPTLTNTNISDLQTKKLVKNTVINYFGILLCGNDFNSTNKSFLNDIYKQSKENEALKTITKSEKELNTLKEEQDLSIIDVSYNDETSSSEIKVEQNSQSALPSEIKVEQNSDPLIDITEIQVIDNPHNIEKNKDVQIETNANVVDEVEDIQVETDILVNLNNDIIDYSNPYQLTPYDILNIEHTFSFIEQKNHVNTTIEEENIEDNVNESIETIPKDNQNNTIKSKI